RRRITDDAQPSIAHLGPPDARITARSIRRYVPQRHMLPLSACRIVSREGRGSRSSRPIAAMMNPGMQYPHCIADSSMNACCTVCNDPLVATPSMVVIDPPATAPTLLSRCVDAAAHRVEAPLT